MSHELLTPDEVDCQLRYPPGYSERLARRGKLSHVVLPDGSIRFTSKSINQLLVNGQRIKTDEEESRG